MYQFAIKLLSKHFICLAYTTYYTLLHITWLFFCQVHFIHPQHRPCEALRTLFHLRNGITSVDLIPVKTLCLKS